MRGVGLLPRHNSDVCALRPPGSGAWQAYSYRLTGPEQDWIASVVWQAPGVPGTPQWHAGPFSTLPVHTCIGQWHGVAS